MAYEWKTCIHTEKDKRQLCQYAGFGRALCDTFSIQSV